VFYRRWSTGFAPSGHTPSSVLECGRINHRDGVVTYVLRAVAREKTTRVMNGTAVIKIEFNLVSALVSGRRG
jgi:hypothetical protein